MVMEALGCRECRRTGFRGRVGAFELLRMTDNVRDLVVKRADANTIRASAAAERELNLLRDAAWDLVRRGITTPAEAMRVIRV
jgi:type II secretory ATPase GspE/PulE/Tfp pilus assembly ATPase PilB-like protein